MQRFGRVTLKVGKVANLLMQRMAVEVILMQKQQKTIFFYLLVTELDELPGLTNNNELLV
ncbi:hypothetical protein [Spirosoma sp. KNUC1025]|uniref:hypothetical protein n=1 Tax=Spirosoma sp. KNUC1025 TaxID=2894082 RepID=UPI00386DCD99|nr:hypothetical protein LN737_14755 [Spirosoma sp. KNUC1025]